MEAARAVQQNRGFYNAHIPSRLLRSFCALDDPGERTLEMAVRKMGLSARAHDRILKVARIIADLDPSERVTAKHLAEAVQYRSLPKLLDVKIQIDDHTASRMSVRGMAYYYSRVGNTAEMRAPQPVADHLITVLSTKLAISDMQFRNAWGD